MTRVEDKFDLDNPDIRLALPGWEMFTATGKKVHNWLKKNPEITNNLWQLQLVRIVQQSYHPHCPSCTCKKTPQPPPRLLDLADIQNLRHIQLAPVFRQNDTRSGTPSTPP